MRRSLAVFPLLKFLQPDSPQCDAKYSAILYERVIEIAGELITLSGAQVPRKFVIRNRCN